MVRVENPFVGLSRRNAYVVIVGPVRGWRPRQPPRTTPGSPTPGGRWPARAGAATGGIAKGSRMEASRSSHRERLSSPFAVRLWLVLRQAGSRLAWEGPICRPVRARPGSSVMMCAATSSAGADSKRPRRPRVRARRLACWAPRLSDGAGRCEEGAALPRIARQRRVGERLAVCETGGLSHASR